MTFPSTHVNPPTDDTPVPLTLPVRRRRIADALLARMTHATTPPAERALAAERFIAITGVLPAASADDAPFEIYGDDEYPWITVMGRSGGAAAMCPDITDPAAVAAAVRTTGAVPRYWDGAIRAAYPDRGAEAA